MVHGERIELVDGHDKLITSSFRLWLEIENLTSEPRQLSAPFIEAGATHLPVSRWYEEGTAGKPWSGALPAHEKFA